MIRAASVDEDGAAPGKLEDGSTELWVLEASAMSLVAKELLLALVVLWLSMSMDGSEMDDAQRSCKVFTV